MKLRFLLLVAGVMAATTCPAALTFSPDRTQRIEAAYALVLGRAPTAADTGYWQGQPPISAADLVAQLRARLKADPALNRATVIRACEDAFGREPSAAEIAAPEAGRTYTELMDQHIHALGSKPDEYQRTMDRAYRFVIGRGVYPGEIAYWKRQGAIPYVLLVGCVEDWARRNAPGLMETGGLATISPNSRFLTVIRLTAATAAEARAANGIVPPDGADRAEGFGYNLVAPGSDHILTDGQMHFAAVGRADLVLPD